MTAILAIDPGTEQSAFVVYMPEIAKVYQHGIVANVELERMLSRSIVAERCVIEMVASYGMAVGAEIFETVYWVGRFARSWDALGGRLPLADRIYRREIKLHLCDSPRAKDANIRQALLDRYGGNDKIAKGTKKSPGPLHGFKADEWAALAVAITFAERDRQRIRETESVPF